MSQSRPRKGKYGDFFCFLVIVNDVDKDGLRVVSLNKGHLPIYDVYIIISNVDLPVDTPRRSIELGTIPSGVKEMNFHLPFGYYQIDIRTSFSKYT
jgi:hypothetical protein